MTGTHLASTQAALAPTLPVTEASSPGANKPQRRGARLESDAVSTVSPSSKSASCNAMQSRSCFENILLTLLGKPKLCKAIVLVECRPHTWSHVQQHAQSIQQCFFLC